MLIIERTCPISVSTVTSRSRSVLISRMFMMSLPSGNGQHESTSRSGSNLSVHTQQGQSSNISLLTQQGRSMQAASVQCHTILVELSALGVARISTEGRTFPDSMTVIQQLPLSPLIIVYCSHPAATEFFFIHILMTWYTICASKWACVCLHGGDATPAATALPAAMT